MHLDVGRAVNVIKLVSLADEEDATVMDVEEEDDGYETRMRAYNSAWQKCLDRVRVSVFDSCDISLSSNNSLEHPQSTERFRC